MQGVTVTLILRTEKPRPAGGVLLAQSHTPGLGGHGFAGCSPGGANPCSGRRALTGQTFAREGAWTRGSPGWKPHPARAACRAASVEPQELQGSKGLALSKAPVDPRRDACAQEAWRAPDSLPWGRARRLGSRAPPAAVCVQRQPGDPGRTCVLSHVPIRKTSHVPGCGRSDAFRPWRDAGRGAGSPGCRDTPLPPPLRRPLHREAERTGW